MEHSPYLQLPLNLPNRNSKVDGVANAPMEWFVLPKEECVPRQDTLRRFKSEKLYSFKRSVQPSRKLPGTKAQFEETQSIQKQLYQICIDSIMCGRVQFFTSKNSGYELKAGTLKLPRLSRAPLHDRRQKWPIRTSTIGFHYPVTWNAFLHQMEDDQALSEELVNNLENNDSLFKPLCEKPPSENIQSMIDTPDIVRKVQYTKADKKEASVPRNSQSNECNPNYEASLQYNQENVQKKIESAVKWEKHLKEGKQNVGTQ